ncbi:hypothetical protein ACE1CD_14250 [Aerosakkonema sp. BLCC-F183]|uniref:hypothetical protein n=1 Tax=Aerosakkonema sp. BLCC-F183 TaxID=3342834 RepID=UPI0035B9B2F6
MEELISYNATLNQENGKSNLDAMLGLTNPLGSTLDPKPSVGSVSNLATATNLATDPNITTSIYVLNSDEVNTLISPLSSTSQTSDSSSDATSKSSTATPEIDALTGLKLGEVLVDNSKPDSLTNISASQTQTLPDNDKIIISKEIVDKLSSVKTVLAALGNSITQNSLFTQNISTLPKRFDSDKATELVNDVSGSLDKALTVLANTPGLDFNTIFEQLSKSIESIGTLTVAIDGQLITPELINTIKLGPNTEIAFNFDFSKLFTISEALNGETNFEIAGAKTQATINGNANGLGTIGFNFSIGIDRVGKVFINEGGFLSSDIDLNATFAGNAPIKGLVNAGINGTGTLNLDAQLKIDDGDTILNERLYLSDDTAITLFAPNAASFTGGIILDEATVKGSIPALSELELAIAASGSLDFVTGEAKLVVQQDALLDTLVNAAEKGIGSLANQSAKIAQLTQNIPIIGDDLSSTVSSTIKKGLGLDAPDRGAKAYLESLGITVEKLITPEQFFSGNFHTEDALLLRYNPSVRDTFQLNVAGNLDVGLAKLNLNGNLQANPNLAFDIRFGLDLLNGPFMLEGGIIDAELPITGDFHGSARIGKLLKGEVNISNASLNPKAKLTFSDFDSVANERFYLLGSNQFSIDRIFENKEATALRGSLDLLANLTIANPLQDLNIPIINKIIPSDFKFNWNAGVQYDIATNTGKYEVQNDAKFGAILGLFQDSEQGIIDLFLGDLVKYNPIPKDVRDILNEKLPLLDKNLLDIIGVPEVAQILINPEQFKGRNTKQINSKDVSLSLDFINANSIINLLSGNEANLISLDIKQAFTAPTEKIPVVVTPVFSAFGVVNVVADVGIEAKASLSIDTTVGFDTQGFYVLEGGSKAPSGRTVGETLLSLNPELSAILTGTLLLTALPTIDISGEVSVLGKVGIRLDDLPFKPEVDSDPKVRLSGLTNPENLHLNFGIDLGLGLTSNLFPIGNFEIPLIKDGEVEKIIPLYNREAGSIADIKGDVKAFVDKTEKEGLLYSYALGIITGDPTLLTAANALAARQVIPSAKEALSSLADWFKESGTDMLGAAKSIAEVAKEYGLDLAQTAKFLYQEFSGGVAGVANALYNGVTKNIGDIAKGLYDGVTTNLGDIAKGLYNGVTTNLGSIAGGLYNGVTNNIGSVAKGLYDGVTTNLGDIAKGLYSGVTQDLGSIAAGLYNGATKNIGDIAKGLYSGVTQDLGSIAGGLYNGATKNIGDIAKGLYSGVTQDLGSIAAGLYKGVTTNLGSVARGLYNGVTTNLDRIAQGLYNGVSHDLDKIAKVMINEFGTGFFFKIGNLITEFLPDGSKIRNTIVNGVNTLRETFGADGWLRNKTEWLTDNTSITNYFNKGRNYLQETFGADGWLRNKTEWFTNGSQIQSSFQKGKEVLRQTWEANRYIEDTWDSVGNYLGQNTWDSAGNFISGVGNKVSGWVNTVKSWF